MVVRQVVVNNGGKIIFATKFGRRDLRKGLSGAKFDAEADFEVRLPLDPPKPKENCEKQNFQKRFFVKMFFCRRKMKRRESSETRFPKVSLRSEPCSRSKRLFKV